MSSRVDVKQLTLAREMVGENAEETQLLKHMLTEAREYLRSFEWCPPVRREYLGFGVGGVVAVFLFVFSKKVHGTDDELWVVVGDVPSAYFVTDEAPDAASALRVYCELMEKWAAAVLSGRSLDDVFAVEAEPTDEHANMLLSRTQFIRREIIAVLGNAH